MLHAVVHAHQAQQQVFWQYRSFLILLHIIAYRLTVMHAVCSIVCSNANSAAIKGPAVCTCRQNYLHARNLREMAALHAQLNRAVLHRPPDQQEGLEGSASKGKALSEGDAKGLSAPSAFVVQELRIALAAGWADQVGPRA